MPSIEAGQSFTIWIARVVVAVYAVALYRLYRRQWSAFRIASAAGFVIYLIHVVCAFQYFYGWSHATAYRETARQTAELFGVNWGGGLYLNYLFTLLWFADCAVSWTPGLERNPAVLRSRFAAHVFLAFMVLNASVVVWVLRIL